MAVVIPLNNPLGPADDTVTAFLCSTSTSTSTKRLVSGGVLGACRDMRVRAVHACGVRGCGVDAWREPGHQHGCGEAVPSDAGGRRALVASPVAATQTRVGVGWVSAWGAGRRGVFPQCGVEHAWALGQVGRLVTLSGLLSCLTLNF